MGTGYILESQQNDNLQNILRQILLQYAQLCGRIAVAANVAEVISTGGPRKKQKDRTDMKIRFYIMSLWPLFISNGI